MTREEIIRMMIDTESPFVINPIKRIYAEKQLEEYEKQIRADVIEELFNKCVDTVDMDSNYLYAKVNRDNFNIPYIPLKSILKEWIIEKLKENK